MKPARLAILSLVAAAFAATNWASAQSSSDIAEATIRDTSALFNGDYNEATTGYLLVKYSTSQNAAKSYFKFDLAGMNPNTNNALTLTFSTTSANGRQHLQVWALNQAYPGMSANIVWATAQANHTNINSNDMLTSGDYTATPLVDYIASSALGLKTVTLPGPWGSYLIGDQVVLVLTGYNDPATNSANGCRIALNSTQVSYQQLVGAPPTVGPIANVTVISGQTSAAQPFTVNDPEDGPASLVPTATSSSATVVDPALVAFGGSGADRTIAVVGGSPGTANVTVSVTDSVGNTGQRTFTVTVLPADYPPFLVTPAGTNVIAWTNTMVSTSVTVPFTVGDPETPAANLTVSGSIASYSAGLLASLSFGTDASGTNRTLTITPVNDTNGVGVVTVQVGDGVNLTSLSFPVMVLPAANVVFSEHFDYSPDDSELFTDSAGLWGRRNSTAQSVHLWVYGGGGYIRPKASSDDGAARLVGAPYTVGGGSVLYLMCNATWLDGGGAADAPVTSSAGGFVHFCNNPSASSALMAEIGATTNSAPEGYFRLGLNDQNTQLQPNTSVDLMAPSPAAYKVVARYDVDAGRSTLWVNAGSEASPSVSVTDLATPQNVSYVGLRQDVGMGYILVDDLKVVLVKKPVITSIAMPEAGTADIFFGTGQDDAAGAFAIESATDVTATYSVITSSITPLGGGNFRARVTASGTQAFYRVKRLSMTFP